MKPMGYGRILLDWMALIGNTVHLIIIPMQCSFGYPRYKPACAARLMRCAVLARLSARANPNCPHSTAYDPKLRYWGAVRALVIFLDALSFVDMLSRLCTGFFIHKINHARCVASRDFFAASGATLVRFGSPITPVSRSLPLASCRSDDDGPGVDNLGDDDDESTLISSDELAR